MVLYQKPTVYEIITEQPTGFRDVIRVQLAHHKVISSRVKALIKQSSKKDELLDQFWAEYSASVKSISLKRKYNVFVARSLLEEEAVGTFQQSAPIKKSLSDSRQTEDDFTPEEVDKDDKQDKRIEHNDVYVSNSSLSVGTIIKREAVKIHNTYALNPEKCPVDDRKVMTNGLSSILDLCDQSVNSQQRLFSLNQWCWDSV
ncbi:hypothetical protein BD770DRAFT_442009 [Pilaira anomala]|nr:hypothetical protein BD770DRAFT_442009 [Pilaira anomala]